MDRPTNGADRPGGDGHAQNDDAFDVSKIPLETFRVNGFLPSHVFRYHDQNGNPVGAVARFEVGELDPDDKTFRQFRREGQSFKLSLNGKALPLYRLPQLIANPDATVLWVEGEKCAEALAELGSVATTTPGGAKGFDAWLRKNPDGLRHVAGRDVVILGDNDDNGRFYVRTVAPALVDAECTVRVLDPLPWADLGIKADVDDWLKQDHDADDLRKLIADAPEYTPPVPAEAREPEPQSDDEEPLPPPPLDALPTPVADYFEAVAEAYCVDVSMPFTFGIGVASSAIGRSADVLIRSDWREPAPLWLGVIAPPGALKSPVLKAISSPMFAHDRELEDRHKLKLESWEHECAEAKQRGAKSKAALPERPRRSQAVVGDVTIEALAEVLSISPRVLGRYDELKGLFDAMGCYKAKGGHDRQSWLSLHNGAEIIVNRKSQRNGDPLVVPDPRLAIVGATTPASAARLVLDEAGDGMIDRFFFTVPPSVLRAWNVPAIPEALKRDWNDRLLRMCQLPADEPRLVRLSSDAGEVFGPWFETLNPEAAPGFMQGVMGKLAGHAGRIALTLAGLIHPAADWIEAEDIENAIRIADWFLISTFRARQLMLGTETAGLNLSDRARRAHHWLQRHGRTARASEVIAGRIPGIRTVDDVKLAWGELETLKLGFRDTHRTAAGRDVEVFRLFS